MLDQLIVPASHRESLEMAASQYEKHVGLAEEYLTGRGFTYEMAVKYRLGVVVDPRPGHERLAGRLVVPYLTRGGVLAIKARCIQGHDCKEAGHGKYDSPAGQHARLYNVEAFHLRGEVIAIAEGELDAIIGTEVVGIPTVATPGTSLMDHWPRCFADHARVLVVADNDEKEDGSNPGIKHAKSVAKAIPGATIITPPLGLDLNDWVLKEGAESVRKVLLNV